jgi:hypothetical protein
MFSREGVAPLAEDITLRALNIGSIFNNCCKKDKLEYLMRVIGTLS